MEKIVIVATADTVLKLIYVIMLNEVQYQAFSNDYTCFLTTISDERQYYNGATAGKIPS